MRENQPIRLGDRVMDAITTTAGIATARVEYLNGCVQFEIVSPCKPDGERIEGYWVDEAQVEVIDENPLMLGTGEAGEGDDTDDGSTRPAGPGSTPPGMSHPR